MINIAAGRQKFMTLTGELSWQRRRQWTVPGIWLYARQNLNGSRDLYKPRSFQGCLTIHGLAIANHNLPTKFEVSISAHYEDMKDDKNVENGVVWGS